MSYIYFKVWINNLIKKSKIMHEDIDDFEPDLNEYYNMHPEEKKLRNSKYRWKMKYYNGKISYQHYILGLDDFREILDEEDSLEIKNFEKEQQKKKEIENIKKASRDFSIQKEYDELSVKIGCFLGIIVLIAAFVNSLS